MRKPAARVVTFKINDLDVSAREDESIISVAREYGVTIPSLCNLEGLSVWGACRLCVVEIVGSNRLVSACSTHPTEGMQIRTDTRVANVR